MSIMSGRHERAAGDAAGILGSAADRNREVRGAGLGAGLVDMGSYCSASAAVSSTTARWCQRWSVKTSVQLSILA